MGSLVIAVVLVATGFAVVVRGFGAGVGPLSGVLSLGFLGGVAVCGAGIFLLVRGVAQRARAQARPWPFRTAAGRRVWSSYVKSRGDAAASDAAAWNEWEPSELSDDSSIELPVSRADVRAAARALLVSLEDEARRADFSAPRRSTRSACRRARLRVAGQSRPARRRVRSRARPSASPS